jgi:hypothetical protein
MGNWSCQAGALPLQPGPMRASFLAVVIGKTGTFIDQHSPTPRPGQLPRRANRVITHSRLRASSCENDRSTRVAEARQGSALGEEYGGVAGGS